MTRRGRSPVPDYKSVTVFRDHLQSSLANLHREREARAAVLQAFADESSLPLGKLQQESGLDLFEFVEVLRALIDEGVLARGHGGDSVFRLDVDDRDHGVELRAGV